MSSFEAADSYLAPLTLLLGLVTFAGAVGTGLGVLRLGRLRLPTPWRETVGAVLGVLVLSLAVQLLGMAGAAGSGALVTAWAAMLAAGALGWWTRLARAAAPPAAPGPRLVTAATDGASRRDRLATALFGGVVAAGLLANLVVALAPSSKIDEIYYHMLVPARLLRDGALRFYQQPWEAAILPQMAYQIAEAPLHALSAPDAANVLSWCLGATLLWFGWSLIREAGGSSGWALLWLAAIGAGAYTTIWHVTAGAHALGDLAVVAAVAALARRQRLLAAAGAPAFAAAVSVLTVGAAATKISLLPLAAALVLWALFAAAGELPRGGWWRAVLAAAAPWLVFAAPLWVFTWIASGSPFGPVAAGALGGSVYSVPAIQGILDATRETNRLDLAGFVRWEAPQFTPLAVLGVAGFLAASRWPARTRAGLGLLLAVQLALVLVLLPRSIRFLGGLPFALTLLLAMEPGARLRAFTLRPSGLVLAALLVLPWAGVQLAYGSQFFATPLGLTSSTEFRERYVAFTEDYRALDAVLPPDAALLFAPGHRIGSVYAPRGAYHDPADLPPDRPAYYFGIGGVEPGVEVGRGLATGAIVYENPSAVTTTYRTPGRAPERGRLTVTELVRRDGADTTPSRRGTERGAA